jgi:deoxyribose-phosphate aldolase
MSMPWLQRSLEKQLGALLDHTLLRPEASAEEHDRIAEEAKAFGFGAVCVHGAWVQRVAERLVGTGVKTISVAGFPLGTMVSAAKIAETRLAVADGADGIDVVVSIGLIKSREWGAVEDEVSGVVEAAVGHSVKLILETAVLTPEEIERACRVAVSAGAHAVKTSTGFHPKGGATVDAVRLMREVVGPTYGVKASGGIRTGDQAITMLRAGADRVGTSAAVEWTGLVGPGAPTIAELINRPA